jgi:hypothetical protein
MDMDRSALIPCFSRSRDVTYPNVLHVERDTVCRNTLVVRGFEEVIRVALVGEALPQTQHRRLELLWNQDLVREGGEGEVEVVRELSVLQVVRLAEGIPYSVEIGHERRLKVSQGRLADVVSNDEKEEGAPTVETF